MSIDWLSDDLVVLNALLVVAAVALACSLRRHADAIRSAALASLHWSVVHTVESTSPSPSLVAPTPAAEETERKSTRSKERRRRGKDPLRDLFKGGKKSRALLKVVQASDHDHSSHSADTLSNSSLPHNDTASSTSRSQSPDLVTDMDCLARVESDDGSVRSTTPNGNSSSPSAVTSDRDAGETSSSPPESMTVADMQDNISSASTIIPEHALSSPSVSTDIRTPQPRDSQAAYTSETCAKLVRARTKLRLSRMDPTTKSSMLLSTPSPLPDSVATPSNSIYMTPLPLSSTHSTDGNGPSTPTVSRGSMPPSRSLSSEDPSPREPPTQPLDQSTAIELASMRNALNAAHLREEQLRAEAEQASKERDGLRWGWNEDAMGWRRREAELQAQIHHLMQQLQAYAAVASFQAQQTSSSFSSPTSPRAHSSPRVQQHPPASFPSPPVIQTQNSASAPAHVQALLASAPMLTSHSPGYAAYPGPGFGMSPLLWSGLGLCLPNRDGGRPTPDPSVSGSSSRRRRRRRRRLGEIPQSASDESSQGDWDGIEDDSGDEDPWGEEDIFSNNALADAILKRPESIRELSGAGKRSGGRSPMQGVGERKGALKDPALEKTLVDVQQ